MMWAIITAYMYASIMIKCTLAMGHVTVNYSTCTCAYFKTQLEIHLEDFNIAGKLKKVYFC